MHTYYQWWKAKVLRLLIATKIIFIAIFLPFFRFLQIYFTFTPELLVACKQTNLLP
jgi:hypothetical protein